MSVLVGYGSSDDEADDVQSERPSKIAKTEAHSANHLGQTSDSTLSASRNEAKYEVDLHQANLSSESTNERTKPQPQPSEREPSIRISSAEVLKPGPAAPPPAPSPAASTPGSTPASPYTQERQRLRDLTMPTHPNFSIPDSPPRPRTNSEEAASLSATTKKFQRFLDLKKQGTHFNSRLASSSSLRNPSLLPKLMDFAGISWEESHASNLPEELGVPARWPEDCYVENLVKVNERREKKRAAGKEKVDFVPAASKSAASSAAGTPKSVAQDKGWGAERKGRFDR